MNDVVMQQTGNPIPEEGKLQPLKEVRDEASEPELTSDELDWRTLTSAIFAMTIEGGADKRERACS